MLARTSIKELHSASSSLGRLQQNRCRVHRQPWQFLSFEKLGCIVQEPWPKPRRSARPASPANKMRTELRHFFQPAESAERRKGNEDGRGINKSTPAENHCGSRNRADGSGRHALYESLDLSITREATVVRSREYDNQKGGSEDCNCGSGSTN